MRMLPSIYFYATFRALLTDFCSGVNPLTPEDIAEVVVFAASRPENVVIANSLIFPQHQVCLEHSLCHFCHYFFSNKNRALPVTFTRSSKYLPQYTTRSSLHRLPHQKYKIIDLFLTKCQACSVKIMFMQCQLVLSSRFIFIFIFIFIPMRSCLHLRPFLLFPFISPSLSSSLVFCPFAPSFLPFPTNSALAPLVAKKNRTGRKTRGVWPIVPASAIPVPSAVHRLHPPPT